MRDPYLDNARTLLIVLVVLGHGLGVVSTTLGDVIHLWIYSFHMAAFVFVSGYLSKSFVGSTKQYTAMLTTLMVPFLVFQTIGLVERHLMYGTEMRWNYVHAVWTLWFLMALFCWRLATPLLKILRYPVLFAVAVSVVAPLDVALDEQFSIGRVLGFLPFFVLGLVTTPERLAPLRTRTAAVVGPVVLALGVVASVLLQGRLDSTSFLLATSYASHGDDLVRGMVLRVVVLLVGLVGTCAILATTPRGHHWFTVVGRNSLVVYLLHAAILYPLRDRISENVGSTGSTIALVVALTGFALLLGSPWVERATRWLVRPPVERLVVRKPADLGTVSA